MIELVDAFGYMYIVYAPEYFGYSIENNCEIGFAYKPNTIDLKLFEWIYQYG